MMVGRSSILVHVAPRPPLSRRPVEICEHKGVGHPGAPEDRVRRMEQRMDMMQMMMEQMQGQMSEMGRRDPPPAKK
jgi:S-adenosylmethionine synthetase